MPQQKVRLDKAAPHLPSATKFPFDLAMKLEERFENDSELGNPIVDESDWAPPTEHKPMKMEKQKKPAPPRPPAVPQGGSQKASPVSLKMMLLKAQHAGACGQRHKEDQEEERRAWGKFEQIGK